MNGIRDRSLVDLYQKSIKTRVHIFYFSNNNSYLSIHCTFLQGLELISKADLNIFLCWLVSIVRGLFGPFLSSFSSSPMTDESSESELSPFSVLVSFSVLKLLLITSAKQIKRKTKYEVSNPWRDCKKIIYYMTSSVSGQDEKNLALWLATRANEMELSCPLGIRALSRKENLLCCGVLSHIINPLLTKLCRCVFMDLDLANIQPSYSVHKHAKKLGQYPAISLGP